MKASLDSSVLSYRIFFFCQILGFCFCNLKDLFMYINLASQRKKQRQGERDVFLYLVDSPFDEQNNCVARCRSRTWNFVQVSSMGEVCKHSGCLLLTSQAHLQGTGLKLKHLILESLLHGWPAPQVTD